MSIIVGVGVGPTFGAAGTRPPSLGGVPATMNVVFPSNFAYNAGAVTPVTTLLTCTRASSGYYVNADGTLSNFPSNNTLRYGSSGLLVEPASTNFCLQSQDAATGWTTNNTTVTADAIAAPDGTLTADLITEDTATSSHINTRAVAGALTAAASYTASRFVKPNGRTRCRMHIFSDAYLAQVDFTLSGAGTVNATTGSGTITALANGWYYITVTGVAPSVTAITEFLFGMQDAGGNNSYAGDGVSGAYVWGAQFEAGARATTYIPTTVAAATRAADVVTFADLSWFDGALDSSYMRYIASAINSSCLWYFDAPNDKDIEQRTPSTVTARCQSAQSLTLIAAGAVAKIACRLQVNNYAISLNGGAVATAGADTAAGALTAAFLGTDKVASNSISTYILEIAHWKGLAGSDANLVTLSGQ